VNGTLRDGLAALPGDVLLASFHVGPEWVNVFVVRGGALHPYRLPFEAGMLPQPDYDALIVPDASPLLEPIAAHAEGCSLIYLVPHGPLNHVPLHAAVVGGTRLIDLAPVLYLPAARMVPPSRTDGAHALRPLVLGDMTGDLPGTAHEAERVARLMKTEPLVGRQATLRLLAERLPQTNLLHVAGHGYFDPDDPLTSGIPFPDGILTVRHVYDLPLDDCLVVLSGCVTGLGEDRPGEGFASLVGAFFAAGARGLLVSLWEIDDVSTTEFMVAFYKRLVAGTTMAAAIQGSYQELRDDAERSNPETAPFYWAPFKPVGGW
jgi:CHAT domain-containing protein